MIYISRHLIIAFSFVIGLFAQMNCAIAAHARYAAVVVDGTTGKVLHAENAYERRHPASLVKKMTLYLIFEALKAGKINLNTHFKTSYLAAKQIPCKLGLPTGHTITVESIIKGMVTKSANDASVVIAEGMCGSLGNFIQLMNKKAKALGMHSTQFFNTSGVPDSRQITTAMDMAILAQALYRDFPEYYHYFQTKRFAYLGLSHNNHNHMLGKFPGLDGIKTGFTCASGFNISTSAVRYDADNKPRRLFAIVMGGENRHVRDRRAAQLLEAGFRKIGASSVTKLSKPHTVPGTKGGIKVDKKITPIPDIEIKEAETEATQSDLAMEQHSSLGPTSEGSMAKTNYSIGLKDSSMLEASLRQQEVISQPQAQHHSVNYQQIQAVPQMQSPSYIQPTYAQNNIQASAQPVQVITPPQPIVESYPSSQQMLDYVKKTEIISIPKATPTEKVTTLVDSSITNSRSLPESWVVPKAPTTEVKSLAPTKAFTMSPVKKVKHSHKKHSLRKAFKNHRSGKRKVV